MCAVRGRSLNSVYCVRTYEYARACVCARVPVCGLGSGDRSRELRDRPLTPWRVESNMRGKGSGRRILERARPSRTSRKIPRIRDRRDASPPARVYHVLFDVIIVWQCAQTSSRARVTTVIFRAHRSNLLFTLRSARAPTVLNSSARVRQETCVSFDIFLLLVVKHFQVFLFFQTANNFDCSNSTEEYLFF